MTMSWGDKYRAAKPARVTVLEKPFAGLREGSRLFIASPKVIDAYLRAIPPGKTKDVLKYSVLSGLTFYLYNEASFLALDKLNPVTHSVANTLKRVVIIVASCIVFQTPMTLLGGIGSGVAVLGTLLYSLAKKKYSKKGGGH